MFCVCIPIAYCRNIHELQKMLERDLLQAYCAQVWGIVRVNRSWHLQFSCYDRFLVLICGYISYDFVESTEGEHILGFDQATIVL